MPIDINTFPISGRILVTLLLWSGVSAFALGPVVAKREIELTNWGEACAASLTTQIENRRVVKNEAPDLGCREFGQLMDGLLGHGAGQTMCSDEVEGAINGVLDLARKFDPAAQTQASVRELAQRRGDQAAQLAPTRCSCAADMVTSDPIRWGIYSGSGRLAGKGTDNLMSELTRALHQPSCALKPGS